MGSAWVFVPKSRHARTVNRFFSDPKRKLGRDELPLIRGSSSRMRDVDFITTPKTADEQELIPTDFRFAAKSDRIQKTMAPPPLI
jgi:hypothetical protein